MFQRGVLGQREVALQPTQGRREGILLGCSAAARQPASAVVRVLQMPRRSSGQQVAEEREVAPDPKAAVRKRLNVILQEYAGNGVQFPPTPPIIVLDAKQRNERYGLERRAAPQHLVDELLDFEHWETVPINTDRSDRYTAGVQSTTTDKHITVLLGYLGFCAHNVGVPMNELGLGEYADPYKFSTYVGYLLGRGAQRGQVTKHISLAKKVNDYLQSRQPSVPNQRQHGAAMDGWLGRMETQVYRAMPTLARPVVASMDVIWPWIRSMVQRAVAMVEKDKCGGGAMSYVTAAYVNKALVAALVTGAYMPPCRLGVIRSMWHPKYNTYREKCTDRDCQYRGCTGNKIQVVKGPPPAEQTGGGYMEREDDAEVEDLDNCATGDGADAGGPSGRWADGDWHYKYRERYVRFYVVHSKNDRREGNAPVAVFFPRGDIVKLFLAHIFEGHKLMTESVGGRRADLFLKDCKGGALTKENFTGWWRQLMHVTAPHIPAFPPSAARTAFVEDYTSGNGVPPEMWDGAAVVMGNSVDQWGKTYNRSRSSRLAQGAVNIHAEYVDRRLAAADDMRAD